MELVREAYIVPGEEFSDGGTISRYWSEKPTSCQVKNSRTERRILGIGPSIAIPDNAQMDGCRSASTLISCTIHFDMFLWFRDKYRA